MNNYYILHIEFKEQWLKQEIMHMHKLCNSCPNLQISEITTASNSSTRTDLDNNQQSQCTRTPQLNLNQSSLYIPIKIQLSLRRKPQLRPLAIKNHILGLQKHIPKNRKPKPLTALNTTETRRRTVSDGGVVEMLGGKNGFVGTDLDGEGGEGC